MSLKIKVNKLVKHAVLPTRGSVEATGYDLYSTVDEVLWQGEIQVIKTGIRLDLSDAPDDLDVQIRSRSGLSRRGIMVINSPGTIDRDYTGEIGIILANFGTESFHVGKGMRLAQMVFAKAYKDVAFEEIDIVEDNKGRGDKGYGSTGT